MGHTSKWSVIIVNCCKMRYGKANSRYSNIQSHGDLSPISMKSLEIMTVKIELAGMKEEEIDVTLYEDALIVSGERHDDHEHGANLYYHEAQIRYGPFRVEVYIPASIDREAVKARYEDGFLWIDLPKLPV